MPGAECTLRTSFESGPSVRYSERIGDGDEMAEAPLVHGLYFGEIPTFTGILEAQNHKLVNGAKVETTKQLTEFTARIVTGCRLFAEM